MDRRGLRVVLTGVMLGLDVCFSGFVPNEKATLMPKVELMGQMAGRCIKLEESGMKIPLLIMQHLVL